jgi:uncharacterized protein (UPF0297 family)
MEVYFSMDDLTRKFDVVSNDADSRTILRQVYESLRLKGYNPINQIVGYILSEDPTYITNYNNARSLICKLDRDELLREMVVHYLNQ